MPQTSPLNLLGQQRPEQGAYLQQPAGFMDGVEATLYNTRAGIAHAQALAASIMNESDGALQQHQQFAEMMTNKATDLSNSASLGNFFGSVSGDLAGGLGFGALVKKAVEKGVTHYSAHELGKLGGYAAAGFGAGAYSVPGLYNETMNTQLEAGVPYEQALHDAVPSTLFNAGLDAIAPAMMLGRAMRGGTSLPATSGTLTGDIAKPVLTEGLTGGAQAASNIIGIDDAYQPYGVTDAKFWDKVGENAFMEAVGGAPVVAGMALANQAPNPTIAPTAPPAAVPPTAPTTSGAQPTIPTAPIAPTAPTIDPDTDPIVQARLAADPEYQFMHTLNQKMQMAGGTAGFLTPKAVNALAKETAEMIGGDVKAHQKALTHAMNKHRTTITTANGKNLTGVPLQPLLDTRDDIFGHRFRLEQNLQSQALQANPPLPAQKHMVEAARAGLVVNDQVVPGATESLEERAALEATYNKLFADAPTAVSPGAIPALPAPEAVKPHPAMAMSEADIAAAKTSIIVEQALAAQQVAQEKEALDAQKAKAERQAQAAKRKATPEPTFDAPRGTNTEGVLFRQQNLGIADTPVLVDKDGNVFRDGDGGYGNNTWISTNRPIDQLIIEPLNKETAANAGNMKQQSVATPVKDPDTGKRPKANNALGKGSTKKKQTAATPTPEATTAPTTVVVPTPAGDVVVPVATPAPTAAPVARKTVLRNKQQQPVTTEPPVVVPTVAPTVASTAAPTAAPTVAPTAAPAPAKWNPQQLWDDHITEIRHKNENDAYMRPTETRVQQSDGSFIYVPKLSNIVESIKKVILNSRDAIDAQEQLLALEKSQPNTVMSQRVADVTHAVFNSRAGKAAIAAHTTAKRPKARTTLEDDVPEAATAAKIPVNPITDPMGAPAPTNLRAAKFFKGAGKKTLTVREWVAGVATRTSPFASVEIHDETVAILNGLIDANKNAPLTQGFLENALDHVQTELVPKSVQAAARKAEKAAEIQAKEDAKKKAAESVTTTTTTDTPKSTGSAIARRVAESNKRFKPNAKIMNLIKDKPALDKLFGTTIAQQLVSAITAQPTPNAITESLASILERAENLEGDEFTAEQTDLLDQFITRTLVHLREQVKGTETTRNTNLNAESAVTEWTPEQIAEQRDALLAESSRNNGKPTASELQAEVARTAAKADKFNAATTTDTDTPLDVEKNDERNSLASTITNAYDSTAEVISDLTSRFSKMVIDNLLRSGKLTIEDSPREGERPDAAAVIRADGTVTLYRSNMNRGEATAKLMHEIGAHFGLEQVLGGLFNEVHQTVERLAKTGDATATAAIERAARAEGQPSKSETVAYFIEGLEQNGTRPSLINRIVAQVKAWMKQNGLGWLAPKFTAKDLAALAASNISAFAKADNTRSAADRYSMLSSMTTAINNQASRINTIPGRSRLRKVGTALNATMGKGIGLTLRSLIGSSRGVLNAIADSLDASNKPALATQMRGMIDRMQQVAHDQKRHTHEFLHAALTAIGHLPEDSQRRVWAAFQHETPANKLPAFLSPEEIKAHGELRKTFDNYFNRILRPAYERQANTLLARGKPTDDVMRLQMGGDYAVKNGQFVRVKAGTGVYTLTNYRKDFAPRIYNREKIKDDPEKFIQDLRQRANIRESQARSIYHAITEDNADAIQIGSHIGLGLSTHQKARSINLPNHVFEGYLSEDMGAVLPVYLHRTTLHAHFAKEFGQLRTRADGSLDLTDGNEWAEIHNALESQDDRQVFRRTLNLLTGHVGIDDSKAMRTTSAVLRAAGSVMMMSLITLKSLGDAAWLVAAGSPELRKAMRKAILDFTKDMKQTNATNATRKHMLQRAGLLADNAMDRLLADMTDLSATEGLEGIANRITSKFYGMTYIHQWTNILRGVALDAGINIIGESVDVINDANASPEEKAKYQAILDRFDVTPADWETWNKANRPTTQQAFETNDQDLYHSTDRMMQALMAFRDQHIADPTQLDKTWWADTAVGKLFWQFHGYFYALQNNVMPAFFDNMMEVVEGKNKGAAAMNLAGQVVSYLSLAMLMGGVGLFAAHELQYVMPSVVFGDPLPPHALQAMSATDAGLETLKYVALSGFAAESWTNAINSPGGLFDISNLSPSVGFAMRSTIDGVYDAEWSEKAGVLGSNIQSTTDNMFLASILFLLYNKEKVWGAVSKQFQKP